MSVVSRAKNGTFEKHWLPEHDGFLRAHYPTIGNRALAKRMGFAIQTITGNACRLGISKDAGGTDRAFSVGSISTDCRGYKIVKTAELKKGKTGWVRLHIVLWTERYGKVPKGHRICFADGDKENCCIENLVMKSNAETLQASSPPSSPIHVEVAPVSPIEPTA